MRIILLRGGTGADGRRYEARPDVVQDVDDALARLMLGRGPDWAVLPHGDAAVSTEEEDDDETPEQAMWHAVEMAELADDGED